MNENIAERAQADEVTLMNRQLLETAMLTLQGLVQGIVVDSKVNNDEVAKLTDWLTKHQSYCNRHPFSEVIPRLRRILADGVVDEEERADILWLCDRFSMRSIFYDELTGDIQKLQGFLRGLLADGRISEDELAGLAAWVDGHEHLRGSWPYTELDEVIGRVMKDGKIDDEEHSALLRFFEDFSLSA